jgi:O-antigen/teichoic acid export membrane protein
MDQVQPTADNRPPAISSPPIAPATPPDAGAPQASSSLGALYGSGAAREGAWVLAAQAVATIIALIAERFLFRDLAQGERGVLATMLGLRTVLLYAADFGIQLMTVRIGSFYIAKGMQAEADAVFRRALVFRTLAAIGVAFLAVSLSQLFCNQVLAEPDRRNLVFAAAAGLMGMTIVSWGLDVSQCRRRFRAYFIQYVIEALLRAAAIIVVLHGIKGIARNSEAVLWLMGAAVTVTAMLSLMIERHAFSGVKDLGLAAPGKVDAELRAFIPYATAATLLGAVVVNLYPEVFMLNRICGPEETAVFEGARRLASLLPLIVAGIATVLLPRASALETLEQCRGYALKALKVAMPLAILFAGGLALTAGLIVPLMWGSRYADSIAPLRWMCLAHALTFVATPLSFVLLPLKRYGALVALNAISLLLSTAVGWFMINRFGVMGAAWSMLIVRTVTAAATGVVVWICLKPRSRA